jgi:serine/threonine-protein kinase HipA
LLPDVRLAQSTGLLLHAAPPAMQRTVLQRLQGATALGL